MHSIRDEGASQCETDNFIVLFIFVRFKDLKIQVDIERVLVPSTDCSIIFHYRQYSLDWNAYTWNASNFE